MIYNGTFVFHLFLITMPYKILLVEDNEPIRENTVEMLELSEFTVLSACNGKDGLEMAQSEIPDLILCDIQMPLMDGYHLLERIRNLPALSHSRFVFITSSSEKKDIEKGLEMGADDYIVKPFRGEELINRLKILLG